MKPNCYKCTHRGEVPGSAHSSCHHPAFKVIDANRMAEIMALFASTGRIAPIQGKAEGITVRGDPLGIRKGWFNHPWNFDPVWLQECTGYEVKK